MAEKELSLSQDLANLIVEALHEEGLVKYEDIVRAQEIVTGHVDMRLLLEYY